MLIPQDIFSRKCPTPAQYEEAIEKWKQQKGRPREEQEAFYRKHVLPLSCLRVLHERRLVPRRRLLFVPVGMQPYAPLMAILGNPAETVVLLYSPDSKTHAEELEQELGRLLDTHFLLIPISPVDVTDIALAMRAAYIRQGSPPGAEVAADITGGKKAMSAAVAGVGAYFGWDVFYVEGYQERELLGFSHHERILPIANVLEAFGLRERGRVLDLLAAGATGPALDLLKAFLDNNTAMEADRAVEELAYSAHALRIGDFTIFGAHAPRVVELKPEFSVSPKTQKYLKTLAKAKTPGPATADFLTLAARVRESEGLPGEADRLLKLAQPHLLEAHRQATGAQATVSRRLPAALRKPQPHWFSDEIQELDSLFGSGLAGTVEGFR